MKKGWKVFWGIALILIAVLLVLDACGVLVSFQGIFGELSPLAIGGGVMLLAYIVMSLIKGRVVFVLYLLAALFLLFEKNIARLCGLPSEDIINNWILLLAVTLVAIGITMVLPKRRRHGHGVHGFDDDHAGGNLGRSTVYVDCETFKPDVIENNLGSCLVYFENPDAYKGDGTLVVENNLGSLTLHVPEGWDVRMEIENNIGSAYTPKDSGGEKVLYVRGENNLGSISVKRVKH